MRQVPISIQSIASKAQRFSLGNVFALTFNAHFGFCLLIPGLSFVFFAVDSPLFPPSATQADRSLFYGLCLSFTSIGSLIANTFIPIISDHYGRKPAWVISMIALFFVAAGSLSGLIWQSPLIFILAFLLHGLLDANKSTGLASVADASQGQRLVIDMGILQSITAAGACIGPVLGGILAEKNLWLHVAYAWPFMLTLCISIITLIQAFAFQETHSITIRSLSTKPLKFNIRVIVRDYFNLIRQRTLLKLFIVLVLSQLSWSSYYQFIGPFLKTVLNFSPREIGFFMGSIAFWLVLAAGLGLRFLQYWLTDQQIIRSSIISVAVGSIVTLIAGTFIQLFGMKLLLWMAAISVAMGDVIIYSLLTSSLSQKVDSAHRGKAMGLNLVTAMLVWSGTALLGAYLMSINTLGAFYFMPVGICALLLATHFYKKLYVFT